MARKTFAEIAAARKTYDPTVDGYGDPSQWRSAFQDRMGLEEAQEVLGTKGPRGVLGVGPRATWEEIVKAYRKKILEVHPDRIRTSGLSPEEATRRMKEVNAAYTLLAREFRK